MRKCGVLENLLLKEHTHTFCNTGGDVRELDFRFDVNGLKIGAPFHGAPAAPLGLPPAAACCCCNARRGATYPCKAICQTAVIAVVQA